MDFEKDIYSRCPVALQTLMLNMKAFELYLERYGKKFRKLFKEFDKNQWFSETELQELQSNKLKSLIQHAYENVPYYNKVMRNKKLRPDDINTLEDLHKLPILTREDVKQNAKALISKAYPKKLLRHGHTSGTTGSPLDFHYDIQTCVIHLVAVWRQKYWAGMKYGDAIATFQGRLIVPLNQSEPPFWRKNFLNNQLFFSSFHLQEKNLPHYFNKLEKDKIQFIEGYPSNLYILALYLLKKKQTFPMKAVLTSSETLFENQREAIEKAFQCKIFDYYGMAERAVFASECPKHNGHHLNSDYSIAEFLDSNDEPVKKGILGRIVATSLYNYAMPFIRYQTNDSCSQKIEQCSCGRNFPLMDDVATKNESIVTLPDGRLISPSVLTHPFKPMHNIIESQIIQEQIDQLLVRIVKSEHYSDNEEKKLVAAFNERLGDQVTITIEYVNSIHKTKDGKFKWVISKIEPTF